ncbi:MAG: YlxR family protein [Thermodesulfobacteriota bacterium]
MRSARKLTENRPMRTCIGCRKVKEQALLVRFVSKDGGLKVDKMGVLPGRGAYICPDLSCVGDALKNRYMFGRALKAEVEIPDAETFRGLLEI